MAGIISTVLPKKYVHVNTSVRGELKINDLCGSWDESSSKSNGQDDGLWSPRAWVGVLDPPILSFLVLGKVLNLSVLFFPPLQNGVNTRLYLS